MVDVGLDFSNEAGSRCTNGDGVFGRRMIRFGNVASCEDCEVFDEREVLANAEGESAAVMRYGYQRGESFEG